VESTFSAQGLVHSDLRNRMGDATVEAEMFIKLNQRTLEDVEGQRRRKTQSPLDSVGYYAEMGEDYTEGDAPPTIVGVFNRPEAKAEEGKAAAVAAEEEKAEVVPCCHQPCPPLPPAADDVQAFIEHIVTEIGVTPKYKQCCSPARLYSQS
jgi:hypothetical protein